MSNMDAGNPYVPPKDIGPQIMLDAVPYELEFGRSISYVFESPNWIVNVLAVILCTVVGGLIPFLPGLVLIGYQFEIIEGLLANPNQTYPDFKFDKIMQYLLRGLYPMIVAIVGALVAVPVILIVLGIPFGLAAALLGNVDEGLRTVLAIVLIPIGIVYLFFVIFFVNLALLPMVLRAGLAQDIGSAFNYAFVKDFATRMWKDILIAGVFIVFAALAAEIIGLLIFCVGVFFTIAVLQLAQAHIGMQLYRIYLLRGGERIMPKATDAVVFP